MVQKLQKQGQELVLVVDRQLLEQLDIDDRTELELSVQGRTLVIKPLCTEDRQPQPVISFRHGQGDRFRRLA